MQRLKNRLKDLCWAVISGMVTFVALTMTQYFINISIDTLKQIIASLIAFVIYMIEQMKYLKHD